MTGFWLFMLAMDLMIPSAMLGFGLYFSKQAPKEINAVFGYRTSRSMKNQETWAFAHETCGKLWKTMGAVMLPLTALTMLPVWGKEEDAVGMSSLLIVTVQISLMLASIFPVEAALKRTFDEDGNRKE